MGTPTDSLGKSKELPSATKSEQDMAEDAPTTINFLRRKDALDLVPMLGLDNYL